MSNKIFNLAIVGLGGMGDWHRKLIEDIENLTVCGTYDIKEERQEFARNQAAALRQSARAATLTIAFAERPRMPTTIRTPLAPAR